MLHFYLDYLDENEGCPLVVQSDCGTENGNIAAAQCYFREDGTDEYAGEKAHRYGESNVLNHGGLVLEKPDHHGG